MTLKTPWTLIDPDGEGILARIVTDAEMGHVAVFDSAATARAVVETMNRAESREQELAEVTAELASEREAHAQTRAELELLSKELQQIVAPADVGGGWGPQCICTPAERAVLEAMAKMKHRTLSDVVKKSEFYPPCRAELARRGKQPGECTHEGIGLPGCTTCDPRTGPRAGASKRGENPFVGVRASDWLKELREEDGETP